MSSGRISKITPQGDEGFQARDTKFIQILNFDFFYGPKQALFDINLDIPEREIAAFIGPSARNMPDDFRVSITNAPGEKAYPISSFTWLLNRELSRRQEKGVRETGKTLWQIALEASVLAQVPVARLRSRLPVKLPIKY